MTINDLKISVVIPTFNRRDLLRDLLEAFSRQTLPPGDFEVIVVVDGSTDGTWEMLQELETPYQLTYLYQENAGEASSLSPSGVGAARNRGADTAKAPTLLFLDDDMLPLSELLKEHVKTHQNEPDGVVFGNLRPSNEREKMQGWDFWGDETFNKHYKLMEEGQRHPTGWRLYSGNFSVNRELFMKVNGFVNPLSNMRGEDMEFGIRLEFVGATFLFNSKAEAVHRGYRTFESWCNSAYVLGPRDVFLTAQEKYNHVLPEISTKYFRNPIIVRWMVRLILSGNWRFRALVSSLRIFAGVLRG